MRKWVDRLLERMKRAHSNIPQATARSSPHPTEHSDGPPRVRITYGFPSDAPVVERELPFVIGILADLSGNALERRADFRDRKFVTIDRENFDDVLKSLRPRVSFEIDNVAQAGHALRVELAFTRLGDFAPEQLAKKVEPLAHILEVRRELLKASSGRDADTRDIREIDRRISRQLDRILHHPEFQRLEGSWRGLHRLVMNTEADEHLAIRVISVSKRELLDDFRTATEFTESLLSKKVFDYQLGCFGGDPFGALIGDYEFDKSPEDVSLLGHLSRVAARAHAPFVTAAAPAMFGMDSFAKMPTTHDMAKIFDEGDPYHGEWWSFRDSEESRFVAMLLPRVLRRVAYRGDHPVEEFYYQETIGHHDNHCWGNPAYDYALNLTGAFSKYHWCAAIRGPEGGGLVRDLPLHVYKSSEGAVAAMCPVEASIDDVRQQELVDLGFNALVHCKNTDYAAFFTGKSVQRSKRYDITEAVAYVNLLSQVPYLMVVSRIAHYLMAISRDRVGGFASREDCEAFLDRWLSKWVLDDPEATQSAKARRLFRAAHVDVIDEEERPGCYRAIVFVRPHFQLDDLGVSLRVAVDLPRGAE